MKEPILQVETDKMILRHLFHKLFTFSFPDRSEQERGSTFIKEGGLICHIGRSNRKEGTRSGLHGCNMRQSSNFSLGHIPQYFRQKYMLLQNVLIRILKGAIETGIFISSLTVRLLSKCSTAVRLIHACLGLSSIPNDTSLVQQCSIAVGART
jgi:hypothetical protein